MNLVSSFFYFIWAVLAALVLCGCSSEISVSKNSLLERRLYDASDYSTDGLSGSSSNLLSDFQLQEIYQNDPAKLINSLKQLYDADKDPAVIAALADTALQIGYRMQDDMEKSIRYFLAAAVYSSCYLKNVDKCVELYDEQRIRLIRICNSAVTELFFYLKKSRLERSGGFELAMPGTDRKIFFRKPEFALPLPGESVADLTPCADFSTRNLTHDTRVFGLGVPMVATLHKDCRDSLGVPLPGMPLAVTLVLDVDLMPEGANSTAVLRYVYSRTKEKIQVGERIFPLAADFSTPLAKASAMPQKMNFLARTLWVAEASEITGLYLFEPFDENRIPVVFVHGLMSDIRTWGQMLNTLLHDPVVRRKYQFMGFAYSSGNPVFLSGSDLRKSLTGLRQKLLEQKRSTAAFDQMVLVGHSMGGLLSRLQISSCSPKKAAEIMEIKNAALVKKKITGKELLHTEHMFLFEALPFVKRVVYIAVPHRGSEIARSWVGSLGASLITLPVELVKMQVNLLNVLIVQGNAKSKIQYGHNGIDNLRPDAPVLKLLNALPAAEDVPCHSIIGNREQAFTPGGSDGVVPYESSHLDNAVSELVVQSGHSVHRVPLAIQEVRKILLKHLQ